VDRYCLPQQGRERGEAYVYPLIGAKRKAGLAGSPGAGHKAHAMTRALAICNETDAAPVSDGGHDPA
jgi:hypothetical protein